MSQTTSDGGIHWEFWEAQKEALLCLSSECYDVVNFRGGYGSGKSILGSRWVIGTAHGELPGGRSLVLAVDKKKGKSTTFHVLFDELPGEDTAPNNGGDPENSPIVAAYSKSDDRLTLTNGHAIQLGSARAWNSHAGAEYNMIWCDEVAHYTCDIDKLTEMLTSRQRTEQGPNVMLWTSSGNGYNQYWRFVERGLGPDDEPHGTELANVVADTRDNPFLPAKDKLVSQFEGTEREAEALAGGFAASSNRVYPSVTKEKHVIPTEEIDTRHWIWRLLFSKEKPAAYRRGEEAKYGYAYSETGGYVVICLRKTVDGQVVVSEEFIGDNDTDHISDVVRWLGARERASGNVYCDSSTDKYDTETLETQLDGWAYRMGNETDRATPIVRKNLALEPWRNGIGGDEEGTPGILISDECEETMRALLSHTTEDSTTAKYRSTHTLCCDALRAAVHPSPVSDEDEESDRTISETMFRYIHITGALIRVVRALIKVMVMLFVGAGVLSALGVVLFHTPAVETFAAITVVLMLALLFIVTSS